MDTIDKLRSFLSQNNINYVSYYHEPYFKLRDLAELLRLSPDNFVTTYLLKFHAGHCLLVIPSTKKIDRSSLRNAFGKKDIRLVNNSEFKKLFKEFERGTIPPFEKICNLPVYADECLNDMNEIVFNTGSKWESMKIKYIDYVKVAKPRSVILH